MHQYFWTLHYVLIVFSAGWRLRANFISIIYFFSSGCCCATASVSADPDPPQQVAWWLRGGRGRGCFFFVLHGVRVYVFACIIYIHSSPFPSLQAVCGVFDKSVRTLLHDFGPMVAQLSGMLGQIYGAFPQASALDLARQVRPPQIRAWIKELSLWRWWRLSHSLSFRLDCSHICWGGKPHL